MNRKEANTLAVGDRVLIWAESPRACTGTIIEKKLMTFKAKWDDGRIGVIHLDNCEDVTRSDSAAPISPAPSS